MTDDDSERPERSPRRGGSAASPRSATAVQDGDEPGPDATADSADSATTASLPAVGSPGDPYLDRNSRATRGSAGAQAVSARSTTPTESALPPASMPPISATATTAPPTPPPWSAADRSAVPSAVDQYAALGLGGDPAATGPDAATASAAAPSAPAPAPPPAVTSTARRPRGQRTPRRARLQLRHFNVWTVFKFAVVLAVALFFVWLIIVAVLYGTLDHLQAIDKINRTVRTIENDSSTNDAVTPRIVFTAAFLIGLVNIVLFIVLTTIGAVIYNLCADLVGGIEVTLAERD